MTRVGAEDFASEPDAFNRHVREVRLVRRMHRSRIADGNVLHRHPGTGRQMRADVDDRADRHRDERRCSAVGATYASGWTEGAVVGEPGV